MHRTGWVCCVGLALAIVTLACGAPAQAPAQAPAANAVRITVICPPSQANGAPFQVIVNPPFREVDAEVDVTWTRVKQGPGDHSSEFTIDVATAQERLDWPWTGQDEDGNDLGSLPWSGDTAIRGIAKDDQDTDEKKYSITLGCNMDTTMIDPRMKVQ